MAIKKMSQGARAHSLGSDLRPSVEGAVLSETAHRITQILSRILTMSNTLRTIPTTSKRIPLLLDLALPLLALVLLNLDIHHRSMSCTVTSNVK